MGILSLLRNAFGRSRKGRDADATASSREPSSAAAAERPAAAEPERVAVAEPERAAAAERPAAAEPEPTQSVADDLVSAAFDNVTVPKQRPQTPAASADEPEPEKVPEAEPKPSVAETPEPVAEKAPEPKPTAEPEPAVAPEPEPTVAEKTPEPKPEPATEPEPEPAVTEKTPEVEPEVEAQPEPQPSAAAPEPAVAAEPEPEPEPAVAEKTPEPEPEVEAQPEPRPAAAETPESPATSESPESPETPEPVDVAPKATAQTTPGTDAPAPADGDQAPQGPPAADDESSTGGAGGNEKQAEGEAEATKPATPAARLRTRAPALTTAYKAATTALKNHGLTGTRAQVYLVLDRSASMRPYYKDGSAQALGEQALALAAHLDPEATVHVTFFSTEVDGTGELTLDEHENKIDDLHAGLGRMGRTSYHAAVEAVLAHYDAHHGTPDEKSAARPPALVIFQTDGAPDAKTPATQSLTDAAKSHPAVFFSFVAFGDPENKAFDYLRKLKTDNAAHFLAGETPRELTDQELYEGVLANWRP